MAFRPKEEEEILKGQYQTACYDLLTLMLCQELVVLTGRSIRIFLALHLYLPLQHLVSVLFAVASFAADPS